MATPMTSAAAPAWARSHAAISASPDPVCVKERSPRTAPFEYIEIFYNQRRRHSSIGYRTPAQARRDMDHRSGRIGEEPPGPDFGVNVTPKRPKLAPFTDIIDRILAEDRTVHYKQHHTAKRIFERLRDEHGFTGKQTIVKDYVRERCRRLREMFVPLAHPPGHAQTNFGEADAIIAGVEHRAHFFVMTFPHSDACLRPARRRRPGWTGTTEPFSFSTAFPKRSSTTMTSAWCRAFCRTTRGNERGRVARPRKLSRSAERRRRKTVAYIPGTGSSPGPKSHGFWAQRSYQEAQARACCSKYAQRLASLIFSAKG